jgi:flavin reductase (DIM6/NTAB) family NADH-FMN oxidoreductase RutF
MNEFAETLDYPMFVVTARRRRRQDGCLVGFVTQTSIDPPRLLVCLSRANATTRTARRARHLGVHQLATEQLDLARVFGSDSGDWTDKFASVNWEPGPYRVPLVVGVPRWLVGRVLTRINLGDHVGFLLDPVAGGGAGEPDLLTLADVSSIEPGHPA